MCFVLKVKCCEEFNKTSIVKVVVRLCHFQTRCLEELEVRNSSLNETCISTLSKSLRLGAQLQVLRLENCALGGTPLLILVAALKLNVSLKELYLAENYLSAQDAMQLCALMKCNSTLQLLDIR